MKKGMKNRNMKKGMRNAAGAVFAVGLCMVCPWIQASASETGAGTMSAGNIIYEGRTGTAAIYTADIALLKETLRGVCAETYDPASYGHVHQWEYTDITENTHTEHCSQCGGSADLVNAHAEASREKCTIAYDGSDYPGWRYVCDCGFDWLRERYHTPVYTPIDASFHAVTCALHGTAYCGGMGEIEGEHINMPHPTDESHHRPVCEYCKYEGAEQACVFEIEGSLDENGATQMCLYCECGNYVVKTEEVPEQPEEEAETTDPSDEEVATPKTPEEGTEMPDPPEEETETPDSLEEGTENDAPAPQEKETENEGGNE